MALITVDTDSTRAAKPLHGVGQAPFSGLNFRMVKYLKDAGIPFSRLHDVAWYYGGSVFADIPAIFPDFSRDPYDPTAYSFGFTDKFIEALVENDVEPFFRLGVTIENFHAVKAFHIFPPADFDKWARVCEMVVRHYTEGWNNGYRFNIRYWEIWNEADNEREPEANPMWQGTKEQFYDLYETASKHLKKCFPHLKIGGYASCGFYAVLNTDAPTEANVGSRLSYFVEFFDGFLEHVKRTGSPFDFFSWHSYDGIAHNLIYADYAKRRLTGAGCGDVEIFCDEWNLELDQKGTMRHASAVAGMMLAFTEAPLDGAMFYDAGYGISTYAGLFNPLTAKPFPAYYAFVAYNELYKRKTLYKVTVTAGGSGSGCGSGSGYGSGSGSESGSGPCSGSESGESPAGPEPVAGIYAAAGGPPDDMVLVVANTTGSSVPVEVRSSDGLLSVTEKTDIICENSEGRMVPSAEPWCVQPFGVSIFRLRRG
ncbi:MAG: hypothetical protein ILO53_03980 [Clostridia bacterium]|nr:hypothetical protein [Clostridia bacterium]